MRETLRMDLWLFLGGVAVVVFIHLIEAVIVLFRHWAELHDEDDYR